jgi:hypothetical protein
MLEGNLGFKGERGYSNYELAVKNGYQGTEQEWLAQFGVDFNVCVMKDDIAVISFQQDMDDPDYMFMVSIPYPTGFNKDNTIVLSIKEKPSTSNNWLYRQLNHIADTDTYYLTPLWLQPESIMYANQYYDLVGTGIQDDNKYDVQITLMKVDIPQV